MDIQKLANALLLAGALMLAAALAWWIYFFRPIVDQLGIKLSDAGNCLYSMDGPCGMANGIAKFLGKTPYSPYAFWAGIAALVVGVLLKVSRSK
ncbi:MAG: hypothetical protein V4488_17990 [Pseudomonadota bacterium]